MVIQINLVETNGWLFILPPNFLIRQTKYLDFLKKEDKEFIKSYEKHKQKFQHAPLDANKAHRLKYGLKGLWSARCCSGARSGDRLIFFRVADRVIYFLDIVLKHDYKKFQNKVEEIYPEKYLKSIRNKYKSLKFQA